MRSFPNEPSLPRFENDEESKYFEVFTTNTAYEIFPNIEMCTLRSMFLQASESKDSIRHAVIALGALDMTSRASQSQGFTRDVARSIGGNATASYHYRNALKVYARAIKCAQVEGQKDFQTALITSLAILSFEGWVGSHEASVQQIGVGTRLLKEWKERYTERASSGLPTPALSDEENILTNVFARLSIQLRSPTTDRPPQSSVPSRLPPLMIEVPHTLERMPTSFNTLAEAEKFYSLIVRFAVTFVSQALPRIARASSLTGAYTAGAADEVIPAEIAKAQANLTDSLHRWMAAFTPLKISGKIKTLEQEKASITLE